MKIMNTGLGASTHFLNPIDETLRPDRFKPLQVVPLMPNFGARIENVDLCSKLSDETKILLREAWLRYGVVFFGKQQKLTPEQHLEVARIFGDPDPGSHMTDKARVGAEGVDVITTDENRPPPTNVWHSDNTSFAVPSTGTLIQIQIGPQVGGNTAWSCTRKAYDCLSEPMKQYCEGRKAVHYWDDGLDASRKRFGDEIYMDKRRTYPPVEHPVILTHPITGLKSIYVNETYTRNLIGLHKYESSAMLQFFYNWIRMPEFCLYHQWQENDVAVWDNYTMQHYALADYLAHRVNQRVTFAARQDDFKTQAFSAADSQVLVTP